MNSGPRHKHKNAVEIPSTILEGWRRRHLPVRVIDVRSASEFAAGHLPGAVNHPLETLGRIEVDPDERTVLVCHGVDRARIAWHRLAEFGIHAYVLQGGTVGWYAEGRPLEYRAFAGWSLERQLHLGAGLIVLLVTLAAVSVSQKWLVVIAFIGVRMVFTAFRDRCRNDTLMNLLSRMPWNRKTA
jgi:rhodanese-related sulfurtransferase